MSRVHALMVGLLSLLSSPASSAANCTNEAPAFSPVTATFERTCRAGEKIVQVLKAKSPVIKLNFPHPQEVSIKTVSGATSSGHNGHNAQVCIWQSWDMNAPCGQSTMVSSFNDWDGSATCSVVVPAGNQYVKALQLNESADELNTTIEITCR